MGKCRTGVFVSVFCNGRETMDLPDDEVCLRYSAVLLYYLEIPIFTFFERQKCLETMLETFNMHRQSCTYFLIYLKLSCVPVYTMFIPQFIHLFDIFHFSIISWQSGFSGVFATLFVTSEGRVIE